MDDISTYFPKKFEIHVGGYMSSSFSVMKDGTELIYKVYETGYLLKKTTNITPSEKKWNQFWYSCTKLKIWKWKKRYEDPDILDGTSWRVCIKHNSKIIDSSGSNAGPEILNEFFNSINKLLGGVDFH